MYDEEYMVTLVRRRRHIFESTAFKSGLPCDPPLAALT